jgi:hypothetical protein
MTGGRFQAGGREARTGTEILSNHRSYRLKCASAACLVIVFGRAQLFTSTVSKNDRYQRSKDA